MVGPAGEVELIGVGASPGRPVRGVVDLAVVAAGGAVRTRAAAVPGVTDQPLVGGGDALLATQVERALGVVVEDRQVVQRLGGQPDQVAHRQSGARPGAGVGGHADRRVVGRLRGGGQLADGGGDDDRHRVAAVGAELAGGDRGFQGQLHRVVATLPVAALIAAE